ncbi:hypothetical protein IC757_05465 [Wenzhouxiangella sp. AB-CW3]|uniref:hypothetical protein n=1 Tax=Wenzhouxiangella sp. AB-CW3 TaxID=2771012 RepID=UPI00168AD482|nr:hypothetical protein [Wenzhouxiangella sp. AB-CW3]QOC23587.1 hypothetical protein IC757_05465 [Wenzhouxiangella sp. AB-CW3]
MQQSLGTLGSVALVSFVAAMLGTAAGSVVLGDGTKPILRIWGMEDGTGDAPLLVATTATEDSFDNSAFYTVVPEGEQVDTGGLGAMARLEGRGRAVGATLYGENDGEGGIVWGSNSIAVSYNGRPAVGMEVNGFNYSDRPATVRGIDIVNGGSAPTEFGLGVMTSNDHPDGKPRYGIVLAGPEFGHARHSPASRAGLVIDQIDSGQAVRIAAGDYIALDGADAQVRLRYNPEAGQIEFHNGDDLVYSIPL